MSAPQWFIKYRYQVHLSSSEISMFQSSVDMVCVLFNFYSSFCSGSAWNCFPSKEQKLCDGSMWDQMFPNSVFAWVYLLDLCKQHALATALKISFDVCRPSILFVSFFCQKHCILFTLVAVIWRKKLCVLRKAQVPSWDVFHVKLAIKKIGVDMVYTLFSSTAISVADGICQTNSVLFFWCN